MSLQASESMISSTVTEDDSFRLCDGVQLDFYNKINGNIAFNGSLLPPGKYFEPFDDNTSISRPNKPAVIQYARKGFLDVYYYNKLGVISIAKIRLLEPIKLEKLNRTVNRVSSIGIMSVAAAHGWAAKRAILLLISLHEKYPPSWIFDSIESTNVRTFIHNIRCIPHCDVEYKGTPFDSLSLKNIQYMTSFISHLSYLLFASENRFNAPCKKLLSDIENSIHNAPNTDVFLIHCNSYLNLYSSVVDYLKGAIKVDLKWIE